jgi:hypothetical protein
MNLPSGASSASYPTQMIGKLPTKLKTAKCACGEAAQTSRAADHISSLPHALPSPYQGLVSKQDQIHTMYSILDTAFLSPSDAIRPNLGHPGNLLSVPYQPPHLAQKPRRRCGAISPVIPIITVLYHQLDIIVEKIDPQILGRDDRLPLQTVFFLKIVGVSKCTAGDAARSRFRFRDAGSFQTRNMRLYEKPSVLRHDRSVFFS